MTKAEDYRNTLRSLDSWDSFLLAESGLPGKRGNLELAQAVADEGDEETFRAWLSCDAESAPTGSPEEFLAFCGVLGHGRLLAEGNRQVLKILRSSASDPRWRTREAVAMALQRFGAVDFDSLVKEMERWAKGNWLEKRAAAAALCEPALLGKKGQTRRVLKLLDGMTASVQDEQDRRSEEFKAFRKGMGYCWSVAAAALPEDGKPLMEKWLSSDDKDVLWIMKSNLRKNRLVRMDARWVEKWRSHG